MINYWVRFLIAIAIFSLGISPLSLAMAQDKKSMHQAYFTALPDLPLMEGMTEMTDQTVVFDKAEGRVVETLGFLSASSPEKVKIFYDSVFLNLGWKPLKTGGFQRNKEQIFWQTEGLGQGILVRFQLSPLSR